MEYLLKASAIIVLFYACYKIYLQRDTFFEQNRWFLLIGLITAVFMPFIVIPMYVEQTPLALNNMMFVEQANPNTESNSLDVSLILKGIYVLGVVVFIIRFSLQLSSLISVLLQNKHDKSGRYCFIKTNKDISPFSFFNYIVYNPMHFNALEIEQIITHEKVHVHQHHTIDILLAQLACIVFWFNPFIWLYNKALKQNLEFIADKKAIHFSDCKKSYQYTLLKTSMPRHQLALTNNFYNSLIKKRIVMLHKSKSKKINLLKFALIIPALALFLMSFNTKEIIIEKPLTHEKTETLAVKTSSIEVIITKDFSDNDFENLKAKFKNEGITLKIKSVERNKQGDITAIKIEVSSKSSHANYSIDIDEAISPIKISVDDDGKNISIGNSQLKKEYKMVFVSEDGEMHETNNLDSDSHVFVLASDEDFELKKEGTIKEYHIIKGDSMYVNKLHKNAEANEDVIFMTKEGNDKKGIKLIKIRESKKGDSLSWNTNEDEQVFITKDNNAIKKHKIIVKTDGNQPLTIVDGKEISKEEMDKISPDTIDKVEVLKGDSAMDKYGDKGKNGVIIITTKK
ncbi:M56 family metallopeptidase [Yeosuana sp. AK3]